MYKVFLLVLLFIASTSAHAAGMHHGPILTQATFHALEYRADDKLTQLYWDGVLWAGTPMHKVRLATEGQRQSGQQHHELTLGYQRPILPYWDAHLGMRQQEDDGHKVNRAALGLSGLLPYFIETEAFLYLGEANQGSLELMLEKKLKFTQRLGLSPTLKMHIPESGLQHAQMDTDFALRLHYQVLRKFSPYVGLAYSHQHDTANQGVQDLRLWLAGFKFWF